MNGMLQLLINPMLKKWMGTEAFGDYQSVFAVVSIMGTTFGVAANYSRMVRARNQKDTNGDYNIFLTVIAVFGALAILCARVFTFKKDKI